MIDVSAPKPHDPRAPRVTAEELGEEFAEVLSEPAGDLAAELEQLSKAHALLHQALQND